MKNKYDSYLFDDFEREQLEHKYGGYVPNISQFWPPQATVYSNKRVNRGEIKGVQNLFFFTMIERNRKRSKSQNLDFDKNDGNGEKEAPVMNYSQLPTKNNKIEALKIQEMAKSHIQERVRKSTLGGLQRPNY